MASSLPPLGGTRNRNGGRVFRATDCMTPVCLKFGRTMPYPIVACYEKEAPLSDLGQPDHVLGVPRENLTQVDGILTECLHASGELWRQVVVETEGR
jgi:hypothetical protein